MSGDFLARWSRRKQAVRRGEAPPEVEADSAPPAPQAEPVAPEEPPAVPDEPVLGEEEIAALPKLDELTPGSDLSAFLRKGVPEALRNAALRRMWTLDPAIRDFVGEARDYAWDWNTPGGVPCSGELLPGQDVRAMVRQVFGESEPQPIEAEERAEPEVAASRHRDPERTSPPSHPGDAATQHAAAPDEPHGPEDDRSVACETNPFKGLAVPTSPPLVAAPQQTAAPRPSHGDARPRHGGAKPV